MKKFEVARIFNEIADLLEIKEDNPFRIRAYRKAAQNIESLTRDIEELTREGSLEDIPGIGADLAGKIKEYLETGRMSAYENLKKEIPGAILVLMSIPAVGPKKARVFHDKLGIDSIDRLEQACKSHEISKLPGIRQKTEENILKGIEFIRRSAGRIHLGIAWPIATQVVKALRGLKEVKEIEPAGSLRRMKETIGDIDILVVSKKAEKVMDVFTNLSLVDEILAKGKTKSSIRTKDGVQVDVRIVDEGSYGSALQYFTGSKAHNIHLREMAVKRGLKVSEYGIFKEKDDKKLGGKREEDIYKTLGLPFIPPELREDTGEIESALNGTLPDLLSIQDIKGDMHVHSKWSDGAHSIEELVEHAKKMGYSMIAITDHSRGLGVARGLDERRLMEQVRFIRKLNKKLKGFKILSGIEVNILSDGNLDIPDNILKELDLVVASIHTGFQQGSEKLTWRIKQAMRNNFVHVIAHPSGRLLGERDAYELEWEELFKSAKETNTSIEINAYPLRLDLNDINCKRAKEMGVKMVISTDSHTLDQFEYMKLGVSVARRGWLSRSDVLNTLTYNQFMKAIKKHY